MNCFEFLPVFDQRHRGLTLVRLRDNLEIVFCKYFADEKQGDHEMKTSSSYFDFLYHTHKKIRNLVLN